MIAAPVQFTRGWWLAVAGVVAAQVILVLLLADRAPLRVRSHAGEPRVVLAGRVGGELAALTDPTLHVWGGEAGFSAAAWRPTGARVHRPPRYTEPPRFLALAVEDLTGVDAMLASEPGTAAPPPPARVPPAPTPTPDVLAATSLPKASTFELTGALATRWQPATPLLPSQPCADVLAATVVQLRVDAAGRVQSCTLLARSGLPAADVLALELSRQFRFAPLPGAAPLAPAPVQPVTTGEAVFHWHTIAPPPLP